MESQSDGKEDTIARIKEISQQLQARMESQRNTQLDLLASLQSLVPDIVSSIDLSLKVVSSFNHRPFSPTPSLPNPNPNPIPIKPSTKSTLPSTTQNPAAFPARQPESEPMGVDESGSPLSVVRSMVAVCLLGRVPFAPIDSSTVLRKLENDQSATPAERAALRELGGDSGAILAVEMALRSMAEDNGGVELEVFEVSGKSRVMVLAIDRTRLLRELPESKHSNLGSDGNVNHYQSQQQPLVDMNGGVGMFGMGGGPAQRPMPDMWMGPGEPLLAGLPPPGPRGPRGGIGMLGMGRGVGVHPMHRPMAVMQKLRTEEDDMKDLEALLRKKSFMELQKSKTGEELLDLIHRPTARETAVAEKFKTIGGPNLKEYCTSLTKEDCRRQSGSFMACEKVHFRRIIAPHTDINLGDCSFLDTCRHMKTFKMDILGQFGVIMADPPWDIHMELPYGTMADDEMRNLNVPALQTHGLIFLWVTGRAMELGRECLELWGYKRVEEIIWVKTNQLQRIIRTGRTGHWLNHSKEHCLVGIKGSPEVNRNIDTDVIVAEVRETSRKPDEMYPMLERISPRTRKLELFARMHNTHAGWMSLGNQLNGVRLVDEGLRARFKAAYPDVEVQPTSPPRASAMEVDSGPTAQMRSPFAPTEC
ncbi:N6-adenosine-methyltransferase MT-A70-like [Morella rubra]|uniref:N6-adenosine-methyltransferase MT-A70-like n=2 Tax=Morella rubra TaxID=262757 RepID=A0A6A1VUC9_9ROSI|nr:N6-adenosine-methyltransferase MT-A70-like [Morella rubra]KAB1216391.1 N6-adenosine-methyltransferase MT-A70-like [Morella rubra]